MACSCKTRRKFEDQYGTKIPRSKIAVAITKLFLTLLIFVLFTIFTPFMIVLMTYKMTIAKDKTIRLPKFLTQGPKKHGEKLQDSH